MNIEKEIENVYNDLKSIVNQLHQVKTDDDLHQLMLKVSNIAGDALVIRGDSLKSIQHICVIKSYFEYLIMGKSSDATIIAFGMADVLENTIKDSQDVVRNKFKVKS